MLPEATPSLVLFFIYLPSCPLAFGLRRSGGDCVSFGLRHPPLSSSIERIESGGVEV